MPNKNFTQFDNKTQITRNDFVVGYDQAGISEIRSNVGNIVDLALDAAAILIENEIDRNNLGGDGEYVDGDGDYIGEYNDLKFTTSSILRTIAYDGSAFSSPLSLLRGYNYDLSITSTGNNVAIRKDFTDNLEPIDEIFGNDTVDGISEKVLWWTPLSTGTYYIVDITDINKSQTITII